MNEFTLCNLYNNGIIDYIPDLSGNSVNYGQNQYLNNAMSGNLYKNYGLAKDGFYAQQQNCQHSLENGCTNQSAGMNGFGIQGVGVNSSAGMNGFGGGFGELGNSTVTTVKKIPNAVWGVVSAGIAIGAICLAFKKGKKPPVENQQGFFQKLFKRNK